MATEENHQVTQQTVSAEENIMTENSDIATIWRDTILPNIFSDDRWQWYGKYRAYAEVNGFKGGVVLATKKPAFASFALDKASFDRLLAAKRAHRLDAAYVVKAEVSASGARTYRDSMDAEKYYDSVVWNLVSRESTAGPFYVLPLDPAEEPF
jgi:hypothetical protein